MIYKAKKISSGCYNYRGWEVVNMEGYGSRHWNVCPPNQPPSDSTNTLWQAKEMIDDYFDRGLGE